MFDYLEHMTTEYHAALVALRDAAPEGYPALADVHGPADRAYLNELIAAHEREMDAARHRANYEAANTLRVSGENVRLRAEVRQLKGEVEWLRHQLAELGGDRPREGR